MKRTMMIGLVAMSALGFPAVHAAAPKAASDDPAFQEYMGKMQGHMKLMQEQRQSIRQTSDPAQRQKLMQEHWTSMQEGMRMMHGSDTMPGCGMMMGPMMEGMGCWGGGGMQGMGGMHGMSGMQGMGWWNPEDTSPQAMTRRRQMMGACMGMQRQMMQETMKMMDGGMGGMMGPGMTGAPAGK
ncbi:MAG: hypothetical protein KJ787_13515 [Gammaproteobacteria bacterium]|nr:hypothetical protein [Gammaproteobacteria bacterium]MBU1647343.1 hypothetical protein [Gammaproteobacteria bacterium]MBU1973135.1 hypothetical protein [Gammaproteobacteria bacterium]